LIELVFAVFTLREGEGAELFQQCVRPVVLEPDAADGPDKLHYFHLRREGGRAANSSAYVHMPVSDLGDSRRSLSLGDSLSKDNRHVRFSSVSVGFSARLVFSASAKS
jgi:hypothetical protein